MSAPEFVRRGDMGLGLCLLCLGEAKAAPPEQRQPPQFAIALVPHLQALPGGGAAVLVVGCCWDHFGSPGEQQQQRRPLLVATGPVKPQ